MNVGCNRGASAQGPVFRVSFSEELESETLDGRLLVLLSQDDSAEPRFQISDGASTQIVFGMDVEGLAPGVAAQVDSETSFGYPIHSLGDLPEGEYIVQALLHRYETFQRSDGHTVKLPMDRGEGQQWNRAPGNLLSQPATLQVATGGLIEIELDQKIPPIPDPPDTEWVKHVKIRSELLSEFWGRDMYLGAHVLLPKGFDEHPEVRYPLIINHGHFPHDFGGFRPQPPDPDLEPDYSERFGVEGYNRIVQQAAHQFYLDWTGPDFPRWLIIEIQHANPYYDDSYAVNSANVGPYGDAITHELVPYIEERFRGIGEGWARFLYGGSTGGWEALAAQIFYPQEYNGAFGACPDPIDFRAYTLVNIYEDENAYYDVQQWKRVPRPGHRDYLGRVNATLEQMNHRELALGSNSRSGQQWDIWEAVYSPVGEDGYPQRIWNKLSGEIDPQVALQWRDNYDLRYILERDWDTLGPMLQGKLHIYCGDMDNYYLNNAVYLMEDFLAKTSDPHYDGEVTYGDRAEHCWNGDPTRPNHLSRLRYHQMYVEKILRRIEASAPPGADLTSWRY
ncbi:MAG TPA: alpha/beta hydrolase-fold protein [Acidobacteriota bacterium]|nr:alpha/beta hydrolase-fold protein [Acidobacteriota bacterium]